MKRTLMIAVLTVQTIFAVSLLGFLAYSPPEEEFRPPVYESNALLVLQPSDTEMLLSVSGQTMDTCTVDVTLEVMDSDGSILSGMIRRLSFEGE